MRKFLIFLVLVVGIFTTAASAYAQTTRRATPTVSKVKQASDEAEATSSAIVLELSVPSPTPKPDLTQKSEETVEPLKRLLDDQSPGQIFPFNPIKYAIRGAVDAGVPPNTIVLLLLLPGVAALIAAARHLVGLRGFGIFLPASLSVVFLAIGPIVGIGLFLIIVAVSTLTRILMRRFKIKLQYLPRMALLLHAVVLGILALLFMAPLVRRPDFSNVSIFPVLILVLLSEDFTRVQLGKSARVAISLALETLILALISYIFLNLKYIQEFALLRPEIWITAVALFDILVGRYIGLRFMEFWRFRKLISS